MSTILSEETCCKRIGVLSGPNLAKEIMKKQPSGSVIASAFDEVITEARKILNILFEKACWVYTGVAVIDTASGKKIVDYEKTKVFMTPLAHREIEQYHKRVHPFDKAGGFDFEGTGSLFIHRIEGCYTNVIGLPMPKLYQMLKKVGVYLL